MKKEEIYVVIDSKKKQKRTVQILTDANEDWYNGISDSNVCKDYPYLRFNGKDWSLFTTMKECNLITLDQLEQLLNPKEIKLDALKLIAESLGFELVEKKREIKKGDFGKFWDRNSEESIFGFLTEIKSNENSFYRDNYISSWLNFRHPTDEEKEQITKNW